MTGATSSKRLDNRRRRIAKQILQLRTDRGWSQTELAGQLGLSQSRLSELERGNGSFSAEQLLLVLELFGVSAAQFADRPANARSKLQIALAQYGAKHLVEPSDTLPSERLADLTRLVIEVLVDGTPRLVTALAPVLIRNGEQVNLSRAQVELRRLGYEHRLPWLVDNVLEAITDLEAERITFKHAFASSANLELFRDLLPKPPASAPLDILDSAIRSAKTMAKVHASGSDASERWHIVTALQPSDFADALRATHDSD